MNATMLTALAQPNRLHIVELLRERPLSVGEITERLRLQQPQVSKHLRVLSRAGLVAARPVAQRRLYQLQPKPFAELGVWLATFRVTHPGRLDALESHLQDVQAEKRNRRKKRHA
jgi:DNA-binding transcriptional ArsR family regulator